MNYFKLYIYIQKEEEYIWILGRGKLKGRMEILFIFLGDLEIDLELECIQLLKLYSRLW